MTATLSLTTIYRLILLTIFGLIVFHAPFSVGLGSWLPDFALLIKAWKELLMLLALPLGLYLAVKHSLVSQLRRNRLIQLIFTYGVLHIVLLLGFRADLLAGLAGLAIDLRYLLFFVLVFVGVKIHPPLGRQLIIVGAIAAGVSVLFGLLQIFVLPVDFLSHIGYDKNTTIAPYLTIDQNPNFVRINGSLRGPNPLGAYMLIVMCLTGAYLLYLHTKTKQLTRFKLLLIGLMIGAAIVLWASYSRSALVATVVALGVVVGIGYSRQLRRPGVLGAVAVLVFAVVVGLFVARGSSLVQHVLVHNNPKDSVAENSNEGHVESLTHGFGQMLTQPLGAGPGSTGSASLLSDRPVIIENQFLFTAHETGWLGLALFLAVIGLVLWRLWPTVTSGWLSKGVFASGIGLLLIGLLLPVWADDTVSLVWWGLAAIALANPVLQKRAL